MKTLNDKLNDLLVQADNLLLEVMRVDAPKLPGRKRNLLYQFVQDMKWENRTHADVESAK